MSTNNIDFAICQQSPQGGECRFSIMLPQEPPRGGKQATSLDMNGNSGEGTRTLDTADMSRMLYHLSYAAVISCKGL